VPQSNPGANKQIKEKLLELKIVFKNSANALVLCAISKSFGKN
jgi:hypothetical protein